MNETGNQLTVTLPKSETTEQTFKAHEVLLCAQTLAEAFPGLNVELRVSEFAPTMSVHNLKSEADALGIIAALGATELRRGFGGYEKMTGVPWSYIEAQAPGGALRVTCFFTGRVAGY